MKTLNNTPFHGYVNSTLDNAVRVRLPNGQILALLIKPTGIEASLLGIVLRVPDPLRQITNATQLVDFLHSHRLGLEGQEIIIGGQTNAPAPQTLKTSPPISLDDL